MLPSPLPVALDEQEGFVRALVSLQLPNREENGLFMGAVGVPHGPPLTKEIATLV